MTGLAHLAPDPGKPPRIVPALSIETPRLLLRAGPADPAGALGMNILLKPSFAEAGWIDFRRHDGFDAVAGLCFFLAPPFRGRGLMREALRAAAPRAIRLLGARALRATLPTDAKAAHAVVRSIGLIETRRRGAVIRFEKELSVLF